MRWLFLVLLSIGCDSAYSDAQTAGTVEAYEAFLKANPTHPQKIKAEMELEDLYVKKARKSQSLEDFDKYLNRFDSANKSSLYEKVERERKDLAMTEAFDKRNPKALKEFASYYETSDPLNARKARRLTKVAEYMKSLTISPLEKEKTNLSNDANGPLNGWKFATDITNNGDKEIMYLKAEIVFYNAEGRAIDRATDEDTVIIGELKGREWATPKKQKPPFKPGETRKWEYTTGETPPGWGQKVKMNLINIQFK